MSSISSQYLQRALALAERYSAEKRQLAEFDLAHPIVADDEGSVWDFMLPDDPKKVRRQEIVAKLDRTASALYLAVDNLVAIYCDEIRESAEYQASRKARHHDVSDARAVYSTERQLLGLAREIRLGIKSLLALIKDPTRAVNDILLGVDDELEIFERWRDLRYKVTRLARLCAETPLVQLDEFIPNGVYLIEEQDQSGTISTLIDAFWELGPRTIPRTGEIALTMVSLSDGLQKWIRLVEATVMDEVTTEAEAKAKSLEEAVLAEARARLPATLRPWHALPE